MPLRPTNKSRDLIYLVNSYRTRCFEFNILLGRGVTCSRIDRYKFALRQPATIRNRIVWGIGGRRRRLLEKAIAPQFALASWPTHYLSNITAYCPHAHRPRIINCHIALPMILASAPNAKRWLTARKNFRFRATKVCAWVCSYTINNFPFHYGTSLFSEMSNSSREARYTWPSSQQCPTFIKCFSPTICSRNWRRTLVPTKLPANRTMDIRSLATPDH